MIPQQYYLFPGIQKSKKHLISLDVVEYIIASTLKFLVITITVLFKKNDDVTYEED